MSLSAPVRPQAALKENRVVLLLLLCGLGVLGMTCGGGVLVYTSSRSFVDSAEWLEHTHTVLDTLQLEVIRLDRVVSNMQLYALSRGEDQFRAALASSDALNNGAQRLHELVRDNPSQTRHVDDLEAQLQILAREMESARTSAVAPEKEIRDCRSTLNLMQNQERSLLEQRLNAYQRSVIRSLFWGSLYLGFSLLVLIALFSVLLRDALRRRRFEERLSRANQSLAATVEELGTRVREAALAKNARDELQLCVLPEEAYASAARHLEQIVPGSSGAILILNNSRSVMSNVAEWNFPDELLDGFDPTVCCGLRAGRSRWRRPGESEIHCGHFLGHAPENYMCVPLSALGETLGFAYLSCPTAEIAALAETRLGLIGEMVELAAMAIAGLNLRGKLENQSIRDSLTSLFNRHFMEIALERELQRASRQGTTLALLMLDVDHFKTFNDSFGHEAGDQVLQGLADCLTRSVRGEDIVCRYGGEEFVVIVPEISMELAMARAEILREQAGQIRMHFHGETLRPISISVGVAMYPDPARDASDLMRMADRAMYQAKNGGRNQVRLAHA